MYRDARSHLAIMCPAAFSAPILEIVDLFFDDRNLPRNIDEFLLSICELSYFCVRNDGALAYVKEVLWIQSDVENRLTLRDLHQSDRAKLLKFSADFVSSNIFLIKYLSEALDEGASNQKFYTLIKLIHATYGISSTGVFNDSSQRIVLEGMAARARLSKGAVERRTREAERRTRAKDELRKMWGSGISNSDKAARIVQPRLQQLIGVPIDPKEFPKPSTIRKMVAEIAAEKVQ